MHLKKEQLALHIKRLHIKNLSTLEILLHDKEMCLGVSYLINATKKTKSSPQQGIFKQKLACLQICLNICSKNSFVEGLLVASNNGISHHSL